MLTMAEKANDGAIHNNEQIVHHNIKMETSLAWLGWAALVLLIVLLIGASVLCALSGHDWVAGALGVGSTIPVIAGIIGKFVPARQTDSKARKN